MSESMRIDRWLFMCRFFKTRSLATRAVAGGHVRLNGERAAPGTTAKPGTRLEITKNQQTFVVTVKGIPARRGPAREAAGYYEEDAASIAARKERSEALRADRLLTPRTRGRPDKQTRRKLIARNRDQG